MTHELHADADAISAVREGDRERYRELVERYGEKVFAVAWCRLGDRDMAEEVTQETFIKGYRRLALLESSERFGSWITAIARNTAINLGLRRRSELRKREQWALEAPAQVEDSLAEKSDEPMGETLRETLAALPAIHRESLVLFYLDGRSVAEAATLLGLSETAFKTRLHRARTVLREEMETRLEENLAGLRPSSPLPALIMLALPMGKPVWSAGAAIAAALGKISPLGGLTFLIQIVQAGPAVATQYWIGKKEIENLRDRESLQAKNIIRARNVMFGVIVASIIGVAVVNRALDLHRACQVFAVLTLGYCIVGARQLAISRHRNVLAGFFGTALLGLAFVGIGFLGWNVAMLAVIQGIFFIFMSLMLDAQPSRTDLSPFFAAQSEALPSNGREQATARAASADELFQFGKFLGSRMVALDWRRGADWLRLRLAPVTPAGCLGCIPTVWGDASTLTLHTDGRVEAHLGARDRASLLALTPESQVESERLEGAVSLAAAQAIESFRAGRTAEAEQELGAKPSSTVYRVEPKKTVLARTRKWGLRVVGLLMIAEGIWIYQMQKSVTAQGPQSVPQPISPAAQVSPPVKATAPIVEPSRPPQRVELQP